MNGFLREWNWIHLLELLVTCICAFGVVFYGRKACHVSFHELFESKI